MKAKCAGGMVCLWLVASGVGAIGQQAEPPKPEFKIAVISFNALVLQTNEAQRELGALEKKYGAREADLQRQNSDVDAARKQLSDTADKLNEQERAARTQDLNAKEKRLEREAEDYHNDTQADSQQAFQKVAEKVFAFVQDYARQNGYKAILDRGTEAAPLVWYAAEDVDITAALLKAYNAKSGIAAPDGPAKPAGKPAGSGD